MSVSTRRRASPLLYRLCPLEVGPDYQGNLQAISANLLSSLTLTRGGTTGAATTVDANGVLYAPGYRSPRYAHRYDTTSGLWTPRGVLLERSGINICLQSEGFLTTWTVNGTPTNTPAAHTASGVSLSLIGDDDGAASEYYQQAITFTGDAVKAIAVYMKEGTSPAAAGSRLQLVDATAGSDRLFAVVTWVAAAPSVAMTTGTYLGAVRMAGGVYRLLFQTTAVTAANLNRLRIIPATTTAQTGNVYAGGVHVQDAACPSAYIRTTTGAVTRSADSLPVLDTFNLKPQALSWYLKMCEVGSYLLSGSTLAILGGLTTGTGQLRIVQNAAGYQAVHDNGTDAAVTSTLAAFPSIGQTCELLITLSATGSVQISQSIDGATATTAAASAAPAAGLAAAWAFQAGRIGYTDSLLMLEQFKIAAGAKTFAQMRVV